MEKPGKFIYIHVAKGTMRPSNADILNQDWDLWFRNKSVEEEWNTFKDAYFKMLEKHVSHKVIKPGKKLDPPWTHI